MSYQFKAMWTIIAIWQLGCLAMMSVYNHALGYGVVAAYTAWFGDIQASYERFERLAAYFEIIAITAPATIGSLLLFGRLNHLATTWKRSAVSFCGWQLMVVAVLIISYEFGLTYMVNQLVWALFGPPENIYSFRNLALHRTITWLLCTIPVAWIALWAHFKSTDLGATEAKPHRNSAVT